MARVVSSTERTDASGAAVQCYHRLEITDSTEVVWRDFGLLSIGATTADFVNAAHITDHIDQPTLSFDASLLRETGVYSLSPLRTDSPLNDEGGSYVPALDVGRFWRVTNAIVAPGTSLTGRWREVARGFIDYLNVQEPSPVIPIRGRGMEALFIDRDIEADLVYASMSMEDLIQLIIDTYMGADAVTLAGTLSPGFMMDPGTVSAGQGVMAAIADIARITGAVVRFVYNSSDVLELTIFRPNRSPATPDWTIGNTEYKALTSMSLDVGPVVNAIDLTYPDATSGITTISRPIGGTSASITRFRRRWMGITEPRINNSTDANGLIDAIFSDIEFPVMETAFESVGFWFVSLFDYGKLLANGLQFDTDQFGGVTGYTLNFANGQLVATVGMRGTPSGGYRTWLSMADGTAVDPPTVTALTASAGWYETGGYFNLDWTATFNPQTRSLRWELSDTSDFSSIIIDAGVDTSGAVVPGTVWLQQPVTDGDVVYFLRVTPYSGPLDVPLTGVPTGAPGAPVVANTYSERFDADSATISVDRSVTGEQSYHVIGAGIGGGFFRPINNEPPTSNFATLDVRNGHPVLDFDATTQEAAIFTGVFSGSGGVTVAIYCAMTSATSGTVGWDVAFERMDASSLDIDADSFASAQTVTAATVPGTSGQILKLTVSISSGANMDNLAAGEMYRLRVRRDVANDTATGDAELLAVTVG